MRKKVIIGTAVGFSIIALFFLLILFTPLTSRKDVGIRIKNGEGIEAVYAQLDTIANPLNNWMFHLLTNISGYDEHVKPGAYKCTEHSTLRVFREMRNGIQAPVKLVIPPARTSEELAAKLSKILLTDSASLADKFCDSTFCAEYKLTPQTLISIFIANTYEVYWTIKPEALVKRMKKEYDKFWTKARCKKAQAQGLDQLGVITLASIIQKETANDGEKPMVAGMYLNRLHKDMLLQADPTVIYANKDFSMRRVLNKHLTVDSPYNTYKYKGLPPGPICIPDMASVEAVLNPATHEYLYMCAKEDFSGTHNFAVTFAEHKQNAKKYTDALNARGIKK